MYKRGAEGWLKHFDFIILDIICLLLSFMLAYFARMGILDFWAHEEYRSIAIVLVLTNVAVAFLFNTFKNVLKRGYYRELSITIQHVFLVYAVIIVYLFTIHESMTYSRIVINLSFILYMFISYVSRILWKKHLKKVMSLGGKRSLLIVTVESLADEIIQNITTHNYEQYSISGLVILDKNMKGQVVAGVPVLAGEKDAADCACREWIDEVFLSIPNNVPYPEELEAQFIEMGIVVHLGLFKMSSFGDRKRFVERMGNYTVVTTAITDISPVQQLMKRLIDIAGGLVGSLIAVFLIIIIGPMIYIKSPGPIFFKQERIGVNGKRFKIYKFRSMYMDAEKRKAELMSKNRIKDGMMFKLEADPRIIGCRVFEDGSFKKGIGNFIRDYSLDEFPQFFNVLKGEMSLVGTRPPTVDEWEKYELHHRARLAVKPGITGMWQISGRSNILDFEEVVRLDTQYITEWSIGLDLKILVKTVGVVFGKKGSM